MGYVLGKYGEVKRGVDTGGGWRGGVDEWRDVCPAIISTESGYQQQGVRLICK